VVGPNVTLGLDIEVNVSTRDFVGMSRLVFHPDEHRWLLSQVESARLSAFYRLWCAREALYKLMSVLGRRAVLSPLVGVDGTLASQAPIGTVIPCAILLSQLPFAVISHCLHSIRSNPQNLPA
jgi:hypothetical protein